MKSADQQFREAMMLFLDLDRQDEAIRAMALLESRVEPSLRPAISSHRGGMEIDAGRFEDGIATLSGVSPRSALASITLFHALWDHRARGEALMEIVDYHRAHGTAASEHVEVLEELWNSAFKREAPRFLDGWAGALTAEVETAVSVGRFLLVLDGSGALLVLAENRHVAVANLVGEIGGALMDVVVSILEGHLDSTSTPSS